MEVNQANIQKVFNNLFDKFYFFIPNNSEPINYAVVLDTFQFDYERYFPLNKRQMQNSCVVVNDCLKISYEALLSRIELIGILCYRTARWLYENDNEKAANHYSNLGRIISGFKIYYSASIGKGMKINHGLGTVIGANSVCLIDVPDSAVVVGNPDKIITK
jgi:serine O-acetyltransferase